MPQRVVLAHPEFDAGTLCLQYLTAPDDLTEWARDALDLVDLEPMTEREGRDAATLRQALTRIADALAGDRTVAIGDIARLNRLADAPDLAPQVGAGGERGWPVTVSHGNVLATIARDGVRLLTDEPPERVRRCAAADCDLVFLDTSRPGQRRWCSMARCGNRAKVRAFRARP